MVVADTSHSQLKSFAGSGRMVSRLPYIWRYASEHARKVKAGKVQHSKETGRKVQLAVSKARE